MTTRRINLTTATPTQAGRINTIKLVSQSVTGPPGADGAGVSMATKEGGTTKVAVTTVMDFNATNFDVTGSSGTATVVIAAGQYATAAQGTTADNAVPKSLVDAKGDLIAATADNTPARLPVGANGHVLTADSAEATGIKWAAASGGAVDPGWSAKSGTTYRAIPGWTQVSRATSGYGANTYYVPIVVDSAITIADAAIEVTATGTATTGRIAIYNSSTSHQPTTLVSDMGTIAVGTTGTKTATATVTLAAGLYLVAWTFNGTVTTNISIGASGGATSWQSLGNNDMTAIVSVNSNQTGGFANPGTAWTVWAGENRGWYMPVTFRRSA